MGGFVRRGAAAAGDEVSVVNMGGEGAESQETRATEASVRGFWKAYRRYMGPDVRSSAGRAADLLPRVAAAQRRVRARHRRRPPGGVARLLRVAVPLQDHLGREPPARPARRPHLRGLPRHADRPRDRAPRGEHLRAPGLPPPGRPARHSRRRRTTGCARTRPSWWSASCATAPWTSSPPAAISTCSSRRAAPCASASAWSSVTAAASTRSSPFPSSAHILSARRRGTLGWATGVASTVLGLMGFAAVLCLWFPALLTTPELRQVYDMTLMRALIKTTLVAGLRPGRGEPPAQAAQGTRAHRHGPVGPGHVMGGSAVEVATPIRPSDYLGLDWFLLNVLVLAMVFVPIEQLFAQWPEQKIFRPGWTTDLVYFAVSHLGVQATVLLTLVPAAVFFRWAVSPRLQEWLAGQPVRRTVLRDPPHRRSDPVRRASALSPGAAALALSRHPPLEPPPRLARRLAPAPGRHRRDARGGLRAGLRARVRVRPHLCLSRLRLVSGRADPRQPARPLRSPGAHLRHAPLSSLAPQRARRRR